MKIIKFFLYVFLFLFILFFIAASVYVKIYGKSIVEGALNDSLKRNVVLGAVSYHFPFGLQAQNVQIMQALNGGEFLKIKKIVAQLSPNTIFQGNLIFNTVVLDEPSLVIKGKKGSKNILKEPAPRQGVIIVPVQPDLSKKEDDAIIAKDQDKRAPAEVSVQRLVVKRGRLQYTDGLTEKGLSFSLEDVQLKAKRLIFPAKEGRSEFKMSARLIKKDNPISGSNVQGSGWVDAAKKDMQAKVEVVEANGTVGMTVEMICENNNMEVTGEIKMQNLFRGVDQQVSSDISSVNDLVLNALSSAGVE
ncbi:MAG: AsmA family protein, partial [Candidatus Omnitrophica bacterium]|nr:AsmA family protein [Candidatus Omnitrophota bacterium]